MSAQSNIYCNGCNTDEFAYVRYKCEICPNYNLCLTCYNNRKETLNHLSSHTMLRIELPSTINHDSFVKQYSDQMNRLEETYLSQYLSNLSVNNNQPKSIETLDKLSADRLYEYLIRLDPNLKSLAEKLKNQRVSGLDLINFDENDYKKFDITYGEKKKLQLLIELKQLNSNVSDSTQIQNEIIQLKSVIKKQEEEIQEKTNSIQQLEDILEKQEQQTQLQDAIIQQLQEAIEKQKQEMDMLMELVEQQRSLILASQKS
ncbi:unnamed protein product [Rotaria sordida]|uniref:ZZ-type domain-containing protein n=1 Tax=Rotaria sordida TaxID=392033 RepID=A0A814ZB93_9BILA|nr:unnamed protein product [Rotaria sordida]CAF1239593.1 unnamed protein product [Rotaria sordida]